MIKNKALSCMVALGLTLSTAPAVLAGPNDTAGNSGLVDQTEKNPSDAPTEAPGEESSGTPTEETGNATGATEGTEGETATEGTTPTEETPSTEGETSTEGTETTAPTESTTPTETTAPTESTTPTEESSSSLPQTGAATALVVPVLLGGGVAGFALHKKRR